MHSLILMIVAAAVIALSWRLHRKWQREVEQRRALRGEVSQRESAQVRVLRRAARETAARQYGERNDIRERAA